MCRYFKVLQTQLCIGATNFLLYECEQVHKNQSYLHNMYAYTYSYYGSYLFLLYRCNKKSVSFIEFLKGTLIATYHDEMFVTILLIKDRQLLHSKSQNWVNFDV